MGNDAPHRQEGSDEQGGATPKSLLWAFRCAMTATQYDRFIDLLLAKVVGKKVVAGTRYVCDVLLKRSVIILAMYRARRVVRSFKVGGFLPWQKAGTEAPAQALDAL